MLDEISAVVDAMADHGRVDITRSGGAIHLRIPGYRISRVPDDVGDDISWSSPNGIDSSIITPISRGVWTPAQNAELVERTWSEILDRLGLTGDPRLS